jgi:hypothetical protein
MIKVIPSKSDALIIGQEYNLKRRWLDKVGAPADAVERATKQMLQENSLVVDDVAGADALEEIRAMFKTK